MDTAVAEGYLVPPKAVSVPLLFMREGIKYDELSESEKAEYEEKFGDPSNEEVADEISSSALNSWLFNTDTVDKVLNHVMVNGIKVQGGDKLSKTIIFAKNHEHALFVEQRFNKNYPEYAGKFLRVISCGIVGLDKPAVQEAFAEFIQAGSLGADQITFINTIINYLTSNGMIDKAMLFQPPFTFAHQDGLLGVFDDADAGKVIQLIDEHRNFVKPDSCVNIGDDKL